MSLASPIVRLQWPVDIATVKAKYLAGFGNKQNTETLPFSL